MHVGVVKIGSARWGTDVIIHVMVLASISIFLQVNLKGLEGQELVRVLVEGGRWQGLCGRYLSHLCRVERLNTVGFWIKVEVVLLDRLNGLFLVLAFYRE